MVSGLEHWDIRAATAADVPEMMRLIRQLAEFEKAPQEVITTEAQMVKDGFGARPAFEALLVENERRQILGMSLYYFRYSTWKGLRLYLEDLVVDENHRGSGIGKALFEATISLARERNCTGMMWQVLDWNEPAINFYKKYQARLDDEWINCHLDF